MNARNMNVREYVKLTIRSRVGGPHLAKGRSSPVSSLYTYSKSDKIYHIRVVSPWRSTDRTGCSGIRRGGEEQPLTFQCVQKQFQVVLDSI